MRNFCKGAKNCNFYDDRKFFAKIAARLGAKFLNGAKIFFDGATFAREQERYF